MARRSMNVVDDRALAAPRRPRPWLDKARQDRQREVVAHRHIRHDAVGLAVLAAIADAARDRVGGLASARSSLAHQPDRAGVRRDRRRKSPAPSRCGRSRAGRQGRRSGRRCTSTRASRTLRPICSPSAASTSPPVLREAAEKPVAWARTVSRSRPSIAATRCSLSISAIRLVITVRPSRITVTRSQTS